MINVIRNHYLLSMGEIFLVGILSIYLLTLKDLKSDLDIINNFSKIADTLSNICTHLDATLLLRHTQVITVQCENLQHYIYKINKHTCIKSLLV